MPEQDFQEPHRFDDAVARSATGMRRLARAGWSALPKSAAVADAAGVSQTRFIRMTQQRTAYRKVWVFQTEVPLANLGIN